MKAHTLAPLNNQINNQRGLAILETVPLLVIFVVLMSFGLGLFGAVHTAILHSIAARAYSFETFRQRTNLSYFRENESGLDVSRSINFTTKGWRYHAIQHQTDPRQRFVATTRPIALGRAVKGSPGDSNTHNIEIFNILRRNERVAVNPIWITVGYGICLSAPCGK
ncbi:MAG: hypothetical protein AB7G93_19670 [Bdellovibrionales bacterium]